MAKKKSKPELKLIDHEEVSQEVPDAEPVFGTDEDADGIEAELEEAKSPGKPMSKANAARAAIEAGIEKPQEASEHILREYGVEITPQHFSAIKSGLRKKERAAESEVPARRGRRPKSESAATPAPSPARASSSEADLIAAMERMKPLVESMGAERVKRLVDLLG